MKVGFVPLKTTGGFTLKAGPNYRGSMILKEERTSNHIAFNSLVTYQKGNSTYILPNKYKISLAPNSNNLNRSSLQMLNVKIKLCR